jgi:FKBP-type peptidyl-prolyl cis-trans isomerase
MFDKREFFKIEIGVENLIKDLWTRPLESSEMLILWDLLGWEESIVGMILEEKCMLTIPPELVYSSCSFPDYVSANVKLIFEVELREINRKMMEAGLANREDSSQRLMPDLYN